MTKLCEGAKLEVETGMGLICQYYRGVIGSNAVVFIGGGVGDMRVDLSTTKSIVNIKVTKDLLYFVCNDGRGDKVPSVVTDSSRRETFLIIFF